MFGVVNRNPADGSGAGDHYIHQMQHDIWSGIVRTTRGGISSRFGDRLPTLAGIADGAGGCVGATRTWCGILAAHDREPSGLARHRTQVILNNFDIMPQKTSSTTWSTARGASKARPGPGSRSRTRHYQPGNVQLGSTASQQRRPARLTEIAIWTGPICFYRPRGESDKCSRALGCNMLGSIYTTMTPALIQRHLFSTSSSPGPRLRGAGLLCLVMERMAEIIECFGHRADWRPTGTTGRFYYPL